MSWQLNDSLTLSLHCTLPYVIIPYPPLPVILQGIFHLLAQPSLEPVILFSKEVYQLEGPLHAHTQTVEICVLCFDVLKCQTV